MPRLFLRVLSEATPMHEAGEAQDVESEMLVEPSFDIGVEWLIVEDDGHVRGSGVTDYRGLADIADPNIDWLANPDNTVVFLPSQFVLTVTCDVPGKSSAQIKRALPFTVEEFVAADIEDMHIAHAAIKPGKPVICNVVAHNVMQNWLACFKSLSVNPGSFIVDSQLLAPEAGQACVLFEADMALVATHDQAAIVDRGNLVFALNSLSAQEIQVVNGALTDLEAGQLDNNPELNVIELTEHGVLAYLAERHQGAAFINLLQSPYQPQRPKSKHAAKWGVIGKLAAAWLVIAFVSMIAQGWWASSQADRLYADSFALYKAAFPRESQPSSPDQLRRRMRAKLGQASSADGDTNTFVGLASQFANAIDAGSRVESMSYTEQRQELTVEVILKGYEDLDIIKERLSTNGVAVDVVSSEIEDAGARSRLRVRYEE